MTLGDPQPELKPRYLTGDVRAKLISAIKPKLDEQEISTVFDGLEKALHNFCIDLRNDARRGSPAQELERSKAALAKLMQAKSALEQLGPDAKYSIHRHFRHYDESLTPLETVLEGMQEITSVLQAFVDLYLGSTRST